MPGGFLSHNLGKGCTYGHLGEGLAPRRSCSPRGDGNLDRKGDGPGRGRAEGVLAPQDLAHRPALGQFVDELVEVADLLREGILDVFDADPADEAPDLGAVRMQGRGLVEEPLEVNIDRDVAIQVRAAVAGEPTDDRVDVLARAVFALGLLHVEGIHRCEQELGKVSCGHGGLVK